MCDSVRQKLGHTRAGTHNIEISLSLWRLDSSVLNFLSILSDFSLTRETDTKKVEQFCKTSNLQLKVSQWRKITIIFEWSIVLMWKKFEFSVVLFLLLSSECGVSFYWGPAWVNFDSSLFWNCLFTTEKNCGAGISNFNINEVSWTTGIKSNVIFNNLHPLIRLYTKIIVFLVNFIFQIFLKNCSASLRQFLWWEVNLSRLRVNLKQKYPA